jgi:hypothetical protein
MSPSPATPAYHPPAQSYPATSYTPQFAPVAPQHSYDDVTQFNEPDWLDPNFQHYYDPAKLLPEPELPPLDATTVAELSAAFMSGEQATYGYSQPGYEQAYQPWGPNQQGVPQCNDFSGYDQPAPTPAMGYYPQGNVQYDGTTVPEYPSYQAQGAHYYKQY